MEERILEKLRKVLALTTSPVEGEAQAAAAHLQRLLTQYNLDIADLEKRGAGKPAVHRDDHDLGKAAFKWKLDLAEGIASFYYCYPLVNRITKTVAFVGRPDNVQSLQMLYKWLMDQIKVIARDERRNHFDTTGEHIDPLRWQVKFGEGAVERLIDRLTEMKARQEEDAAMADGADDPSCTALAVMGDERNREISDWLESQGMRRIDGRESKRDREYRERREREEARLEALKATDIEAYYAECPWERPKTPEQEEADRLKWEAYLKKERQRDERNRKRRASYIPTGGYREARTDWNKLEQESTARSSGYKAGDRINVQPFIGDGKRNKSKGSLE